MPRFWWVNHNQTARQEIEGRYLWSPQREKNARSQFYDNMLEASPGDLVLSYSQQAVRFVGRVTDFAIPNPKPEEFGSTGAYWSTSGWLLPVFWVPLDPPVSPKALIGRLGPLLPDRYSPIHPESGFGNQKAYLAEVSGDVFQLVTERAGYNQALLLTGGANSLTFEAIREQLEDEIERGINRDLQLSDTVKRTLVDARRGQGRFRQNVESLERACRLTGITNPTLLIASHIKPWRLCATADERLDGMNGLLLTPDADLLFDRGFISFKDDGEVIVSKRADHDDLRRLGFEQLTWQSMGVAEAPSNWRTDAFAVERTRYLDFHRRQVLIN